MKYNDFMALSGFFHDIGKFAQRAAQNKEIKLTSNRSESLDNFSKSVIPKKGGYYHSAFSEFFIAKTLIDNDYGLLSKYFNKNDKDELSTSDFSRASANHHNINSESTVHEQIIAVADRLASSFERDEYQNYKKDHLEYEKIEKEIKASYKKQKLLNMFDNNKYFGIKPLNSKNIFPQSGESEDETAYKNTWDSFIEDINLVNKDDDFSTLINNLEYLVKKHTTFIPSITTFKTKDYKPVKSNIPLYDHLKVTAAFASAISAMKTDTQKRLINSYLSKNKELDEKQFLIITGDFFGIQNFIFSNLKTKYAAKILRAKSAWVQLVTKIIALDIAKKLKISEFSIISTAAGKFEILTANTSDNIKKLKEIQIKLDNYFLENHFGQSGIGINWLKCNYSSFTNKNRYTNLRKKLFQKIEEKKYSKFSFLNKDRREMVFSFDDGLTNKNLCDFCEKRIKIESRKYGNDGVNVCRLCSSYIDLGRQLTNDGFMLIYSNASKQSKGIGVIFDYKVYFTQSLNDLPEFINKKDIIKIYDIGLHKNFRGYAKWELGSYVKTDKESNILDFEHLSLKNQDDIALTYLESEETFKSLMSLKGDVDNMGKFILDKNNNITRSFSTYNFFSRMMDYFFSVYLPYELLQDKYIYTVFSGGDDLFILGAWDQIIEVNQLIKNKFAEFTSEKLSFSTGLIMSKPGKPVSFLAKYSEDALESSKNNSKEAKTKNSTTIFDQTLFFDEYFEVKSMFDNYKSFIDANYCFNNSFWYKIIELSEMQERIQTNALFKPRDALWRSKLNYLFKRNIVPHINKGDLDKMDEFIQDLDGLIDNFGEGIKTVLFEKLYEYRD